MKNAKVRGVSIHTTGNGLAYYIHYDEIGTMNVDKKTYEEAMSSLQQWEHLINRNKEEAKAIKF